MFSLYFGHKDVNSSFMWLGGYSHKFLRTYLKAGKKLTNKEIDAQITWIDIDKDSN